jgi:hypothetical protein
MAPQSEEFSANEGGFFRLAQFIVGITVSWQMCLVVMDGRQAIIANWKQP